MYEEISFDIGCAGVLDFGLVPVVDHEFRLARQASVIFMGADSDVFVSGGGVAVDVAAAAETEFRRSVLGNPIEISDIDWIVSGGEEGGVQCPAVAGVVVLVVVACLHWCVWVGGLAVLDSDAEVGRGEIADFVET